jgi:pimeloyl-ACP methyl ester carboxylesterase
VPTGFALKDLPNPPRDWAQRFFNIQRWTEMPRGGHFAAMEEPELFAEDIRVFFARSGKFTKWTAAEQ